jgi:hypothetical protein
MTPSGRFEPNKSICPLAAAFLFLLFRIESRRRQAGANMESGLGMQAPRCLNITLARGTWRGERPSPPRKRAQALRFHALNLPALSLPFQVSRHDPRRLVELHAQRRDHHRSRQALRQRTEVARDEIARLERRATEIQDLVPRVCGRTDEGLAEYEWQGAGAGGTAEGGEGAARGQSFRWLFFSFACYRGFKTNICSRSFIPLQSSS